MSRILVVDDIAMNRTLLVEELTHRGFQVVEASGGEEALQTLRTEDIDLVLLDIMMPRMSGIEVLREIRRTQSLSELPVILVTARGERKDIVQGLDLGANDYVTKPIDLQVIVARVRTQLALSEANRQLVRLNQQLQQASEKILQLTSSPPALHNLERWMDTTAAELADLIGADVSVMIDQSALIARDTNPSVGASREYDDGHGRRLPIRATGNQVYGEIVVGREDWTESERLLLESFCHELAAALEMRRLRAELSAANKRLTVRRQEMIERGIAALQLCPRCSRCYDHTAARCVHDESPLDAGYLLPLRLSGRYRLIQRIATGGMAHLFSAQDEKLGRDVAVKIIKADQLSDPEMRLRFEQEARAIARIEHPGVSAIFDCGELEDGSMFVIMELLRGLNLAQMIHSYGRGRPEQVAALIRQVGTTLTAVHRAGFIHRDVKPENIFIVEDGDGFRVKLLDFGIVKPIGKPTTLTQSGTFIGTPAYMAPEQIESGTIDERTDVYSFAAVAYEALVGRRVTTEREVAKVFTEILHVNPYPISSFLSGGTDALDALFASALSKQRDARPSSAEEWAAAVGTILDSIEPVHSGWPHSFAPTVAADIRIETIRNPLPESV